MSLPSGQTRRPKQQTASRSVRLEEKLDDLVSLLRHQHGTVDPDQVLDGPNQPKYGLNVNDNISPTMSSSIAPAAVSGGTISDEPSAMQAEESLRKFRGDMIVCSVGFWFIFFPPRTQVLPLTLDIVVYPIRSHTINYVVSATAISISVPVVDHYECDFDVCRHAEFPRQPGAEYRHQQSRCW